MLWNFLPNSRSRSCGQIWFNLSWYISGRRSWPASFFLWNFNDVIKNIATWLTELFALSGIDVFCLVLLRPLKDFIFFHLCNGLNLILFNYVFIFWFFYIVKFLNETCCSSRLLDFRQRRYIARIALSWLLDVWWLWCFLIKRWWWWFSVNKHRTFIISV